MGPHIIPVTLPLVRVARNALAASSVSFPSLAGKVAAARRVIGQDLRKHSSPATRCAFLPGRVPARLFQRVREGCDATDRRPVPRLYRNLSPRQRDREQRRVLHAERRASLGPRSHLISFQVAKRNTRSARRNQRVAPHAHLLGDFRAEFDISSKMLHTSLPAKKSSPVNRSLFTAPSLSKENGSLRQPASTITWPPSPSRRLRSTPRGREASRYAVDLIQPPQLVRLAMKQLARCSKEHTDKHWCDLVSRGWSSLYPSRNSVHRSS